MVYNKLKKEFSLPYLRQIKEEENSCIEVKRKELRLTIHPFQLKNFAVSVKEILSTRFARYNKDLGGILIGYENIVLQSSSGIINNDNCFVHVTIEADFYVFKPEIGQLLKGTVNKKSRSHIGCLVFDLFNVSLPCPEEDEPWLGDTVCLGQEVLFRIVNTNLNRKLPYIQGEILSILTDPDSGISTGEENVHSKITKFTDGSSDTEQYKKKKKHKHKERISDVSPVNHDYSIGEEVEDEGEFSGKSPSKKTKKKSKNSLNTTEYSYNSISDEQEMYEMGTEVTHSVKEKSPAKKKKYRSHHLESVGNSIDAIEATDVSEVFSKKRKRRVVNADEMEDSVDISPKKKKRKGNDGN